MCQCKSLENKITVKMVIFYPPLHSKNKQTAQMNELSTMSSQKHLMMLSTLKSRYSLHKTHSNVLKTSTHRLGISKEQISSYCIFMYFFLVELRLDLLSCQKNILNNFYLNKARAMREQKTVQSPVSTKAQSYLTIWSE